MKYVIINTYATYFCIKHSLFHESEIVQQKLLYYE